MSNNKTTIPESEAAPGGTADTVTLVVLDDGGTPQLFAQDENDVLYQITPPSTGSSESAANVFTFRPSSGLTGPLVFDDFDDLYNALNAVRSANSNSGKYKIVFDDQDIGGPGNTVVAQSPAGNYTYDFYNTELVGVHEDQNVLLDIADQGGETDSLTCINALWFEGLTIRAAGQDTAFDALADQTFTLKRTTFNGDGEYVLDVLGVTGCVVHMDDESRLQRTTNAAIRVNTVALLIHVTGNNTTIDNLGVAGFVGGSIDVFIYSSSAQVDPQQDILLQSFTMRTAAGYWSADPNGDLTAQPGTLVSDENTGTIWRNTDGATTWFGAGSAPIGFSEFGDGSDGDVIISSLVALTRDMFYNNLTINTTFSIATNGYRVFVKELLTLSGTGRIHRQGTAGGVGGAASASIGPCGVGTGGATYTAAVLPANVAGGTNSAGSPTAGTPSTVGVRPFVTAAAAVGGAASAGGGVGNNGVSPTGIGRGGGGASGGGDGVAANSSVGAAGGSITSALDSTGSLRDLIQAKFGRAISGTNSSWSMGSGGGGGSCGRNAGTNIPSGGGGGGSSGGYVYVAAREIVGTGSIDAYGGAGGTSGSAAGGSSVNEGTGGGGGGGGGGIVVVVIGTGSFPTTNVYGGAGGLASAATKGAGNKGGDGGTGAPGVSILYRAGL